MNDSVTTYLNQVGPITKQPAATNSTVCGFYVHTILGFRRSTVVLYCHVLSCTLHNESVCTSGNRMNLTEMYM